MINVLMKERTGTKGKNNFGSEMILETYISAKIVKVRFIESGNMVTTTWRRFSNGSVRNVYDKTVFGLGYLGEGHYKAKENNKDTKQYTSWYAMMTRCYSNKYHEEYPSYVGCTVSEEWHNFQNFAAWYDQNIYNINNVKMCVDKDILIKGNKIYSPETCIFVPDFINSLFTKSKATRGDLPIGVKYYDHFNKYVARCSNGKGEVIHLGSYSTSEEAFETYRTFKEKLIKQIAEEYKNKIPTRLYEAMINYIVEITD